MTIDDKRRQRNWKIYRKKLKTEANFQKQNRDKINIKKKNSDHLFSVLSSMKMNYFYIRFMGAGWRSCGISKLREIVWTSFQFS